MKGIKDMRKFSDILEATLPSQEENVVTETENEDFDEVMNFLEEVCKESDDDDEEKEVEDEDGEGKEEEGEEGDSEDDAASAADGAEDGADEFDPDELSDEELENMDRELSADVIDSVADDGEGEVELTPEEEMEADDMMSVAATTMLVKDQLNAQERAEFLKDEAQVKCAINEGFLTDADVNEMMIEAGLVTEAKYNNRMIIKLDAASKKKQLYALAVNVSAAAHHDPDWIKYKKCIKLKKLLHAKLERKYKSEAAKRARVYFKRINKSGSPTVAALAK